MTTDHPSQSPQHQQRTPCQLASVSTAVSMGPAPTEQDRYAPADPDQTTDHPRRSMPSPGTPGHNARAATGRADSPLTAQVELANLKKDQQVQEQVL